MKTVSVSVSACLLKPVVLAALLSARYAHAEGPGLPVTVPDAGAFLQQIHPSLPPAAPAGAPAIHLEAPANTSAPASTPLRVDHLRVEGNTAIDTPTLHALVADREGRALTLAELDDAAQRITEYYHAHGYPLARAIIPAQTIADGTVRIQVIEGRYDRIRLRNRSKVTDALLEATVAPLRGGDLIVGPALDRALLLLADVPGVAVSATLKPGGTVGTSDIDIDADVNPTTLATLVADNYGNRYVGRARVSGGIDVVNPLRHGDVLSLNVVSTGDRMDYGRLSYDTLLNGMGTRLGGAYSVLYYKLGDTARALDAHGTAHVVSAWIKQPLVRRTQFNVYAQLEYDEKWLDDHIDASAIKTDRHLGNGVFSVNGDARDGVGAGGISLWSLAWTFGRARFDDDAAQAADTATARTGGAFSKFNVNVSRLQGVAARDAVYVNLASQWSDANLDSAEKLTVGGPYSVRAYDIGAISGDAGYTGTVEWRHDLGSRFGGQWQALAFYDAAYVRINRFRWTGGDNRALLSGAGIGVNWTGPHLWRAGVSLAARVGRPSAAVGDPASMRGWVSVGKGF